MRMTDSKHIQFNAWSSKRIREGKKWATSRNKPYEDDERVLGIIKLPWWFIRDYLYMVEGAESPEELQSVINQAQRRVVKDDDTFYVHFGNFNLEPRCQQK
jgi:hypothetical protein